MEQFKMEIRHNDGNNERIISIGHFYSVIEMTDFLNRHPKYKMLHIQMFKLVDKQWEQFLELQESSVEFNKFLMRER